MKKENIIGRGINYLSSEAKSSVWGVKTLCGRKYKVFTYSRYRFVEILGRGCVFKISVPYQEEGVILKIQRGKDDLEIYQGLGEEIITSDYFQSCLHPTEGEISLLSTLYPEIVELIKDFGGICEKV